MKINIAQTSIASGQHASAQGADLIRQAIDKKGDVRIILATGSSQFDMLDKLVKQTNVDWSKCTVFHLDEYINLSQNHPASFVKYIKERFVNRLHKLKHFEAIDGMANDLESEIARLSRVIGIAPIDVAFIGIGENGHLAFNDPPANFSENNPYLRASLDPACRAQQVSEGWFDSLADVPNEAITMSISQILRSHNIICTVPDARKAQAVRDAVQGSITNMCPASALQNHPNVALFLDAAAASKLDGHCADE